MHEIVTIVRCDTCDDIISDGTGYSFQITGTGLSKNGKNIDLCEQCYGAVSMDSVVNSGTVREPKSKPKPKTTNVRTDGLICLECGFQAKNFTGLGVHIHRKHR